MRHSRIPYYESKPGGSDIMSIGFALPWAHQENGLSSQPVCVRIFLDPFSALSPQLATSSLNSTGSVCLNSKESRIIVFPTRTPLKHVSYNSAQPLSILAYKRISWVSRLQSVTYSCLTSIPSRA